MLHFQLWMILIRINWVFKKFGYHLRWTLQCNYTFRFSRRLDMKHPILSLPSFYLVLQIGKIFWLLFGNPKVDASIETPGFFPIAYILYRESLWIYLAYRIMSSVQLSDYNSLIEYMKAMNLTNAASALESLVKKSVWVLWVYLPIVGKEISLYLWWSHFRGIEVGDST